MLVHENEHFERTKFYSLISITWVTRRYQYMNVSREKKKTGRHWKWKGEWTILENVDKIFTHEIMYFYPYFKHLLYNKSRLLMYKTYSFISCTELSIYSWVQCTIYVHHADNTVSFTSDVTTQVLIFIGIAIQKWKNFW